jgi:hypothetical protein
LIEGLATRSHGVVARAELLGLGLSPDEILHRMRSGALIRVHRGVYRVGHQAPSTLAGYMAAVKACGSGSLVAIGAAAYLWELIKGTSPPPVVLTPTKRRVRGVRTRQSRGIDPADATTFRGIPVTTVARTLVDQAAELSVEKLARACHEAGVKHRTTPAEVEAVLDRRPNSPGARKLRRILRGDERVTLSPLEKRFLALLRQRGLPLPSETNRHFAGKRVDCRWPDSSLTVELDSYRYHSSRHAWETDHRRERLARAAGDEFRRYTWGDVFEQPRFMLSELRDLLSPR